MTHFASSKALREGRLINYSADFRWKFFLSTFVYNNIWKLSIPVPSHFKTFNSFRKPKISLKRANIFLPRRSFALLCTDALIRLPFSVVFSIVQSNLYFFTLWVVDFRIINSPRIQYHCKGILFIAKQQTEDGSLRFILNQKHNWSILSFCRPGRKRILNDLEVLLCYKLWSIIHHNP